MEPTKDRSLELRLNSVQDAKSAVYNSKKIMETVQSLGLDSIQLLIAEEVKNEILAIVAGAFRIKTWTGYVKCRDQNALFSLPHFQEKTIIPVNGNGDRREPIIIKKEPKSRTVYAPTVSAPQPPKLQKKRGPKKGWKKTVHAKEVTPDESLPPVRT